jgi:cation diffusion facilitator CzcD-associated flavoprotein CzcO
VPALAERLDEGVLQLRSSDYRSPRSISTGPVLVVGGGNSGFQIAEELSRTHEVHVARGALAISTASSPNSSWPAEELFPLADRRALDPVGRLKLGRDPNPPRRLADDRRELIPLVAAPVSGELRGDHAVGKPVRGRDG